MKTTLKLKKTSASKVVEPKKIEIKKKDKSLLKNNPYFPNKYSTFRKNYKNYDVDVEVSKSLMRFIYRYRFAKVFKSITFKDSKFIDQTLKSYEACNKLFLAYTAYEVVRKAAILLELPSSFYESIEADRIKADNFRRNEKFISFISSITKDKEQKEAFNKFFRKNAPTNDILFLIYMIRNAFSHGSFTPRGSGLDKKYHIDDIAYLTETLLDHANEVFVVAVERCQLTLKVQN